MIRKLLLTLALLTALLTPLSIRAQVSGVGQLGCSGTPVTGTGWTSATANNSTQALVVNSSVTAILVQLNQTTTITGGVVTFQYNGDGASFITIPVAQVLNPDTGAQLTNPYTLVASTNQQFLILLNGKTNAQIKLTSVITGTATITPFTTALCVLPTWPTGIGLTQPVSLASVPLPTGASTSAKQPSLGTAGAASADVISIQGIASMTPVAISAASLPLPTGAALDATLTGGTAKSIPEPSTASGDAITPCNILSAASNNSTSCKGSAGNFYGYEIFNTTTTTYYLRVYNTAAAPTCTSATGFIRSIPIPPAGVAGQVGGAISNLSLPVNFTTGIGYCITAGSSSTDNTSAVTGIFGEIRYK